jgi:hypothetical protein
MPSNPLDNMPEALRRQNIALDKFSLISKESQMNGDPNIGGSMIFASSGHMEKVSSPVSTLVKQGKVILFIRYSYTSTLDNFKTVQPSISRSTIYAFYIFWFVMFRFSIFLCFGLILLAQILAYCDSALTYQVWSPKYMLLDFGD